MSYVQRSFDFEDDLFDRSVSYEEIMQIMDNRHDFERFGDADTY